ncbi:MAG: amidase, partial [Patescibacteria group bacterium]
MIKEIHNNLISKKIGAVELAEKYLIQAKGLNKKYNSFISFTEELAIETAKSIDEKIKKGENIGYLAGIPVSIKDNILVKGYKATAGSKILKNYTASYDADVVSYLKQEQALIIGKTNMDEFAMGASGEYSAFGRTKNPIDINLVTGGSSSGSAASVAIEQAIISLGSDTGGSVRQPASFCSVVGFKPTYGMVSRSGLISMASSLDQIGIISNSVEDIALTLEVISQDTPYDSTKKR